MNISVILPAAGLGRRFASDGRASSSKIEFELLHKPVFLRAIELFQNRLEVEQIILAVDPGKLDDFRLRWGDKLDFHGVRLIAGGAAERWETVQLALGHVADDATHVAVHDAARPCASQAMIDRVFAAALKYSAAVPGVAMGDTVKRVESESGEGRGDKPEGDPLDAIFGSQASTVGNAHRIIETVPRKDLFRVQTPQVFERELITEAYSALDTATAKGITDDASVAERAGHDVYIIAGDPSNLKLTRPEDVELMEAVLRMREEKDAKAKAEQVLFGDEDEDED